METIKNVLKTIPTGAWIVVGIFALVFFYWFSNDIGEWWSNRKSDKFDQAQVEKDKKITDLTAERDALKQKSVEAEIREQSKIVEVDNLKAEMKRRGENVDNAQKKIDDALSEYAKDQSIINKVTTGELSYYDLCIMQCTTSAEQGYACIPNKEKYCEKVRK